MCSEKCSIEFFSIKNFSTDEKFSTRKMFDEKFSRPKKIENLRKIENVEKSKKNEKSRKNEIFEKSKNLNFRFSIFPRFLKIFGSIFFGRKIFYEEKYFFGRKILFGGKILSWWKIRAFGRDFHGGHGNHTKIMVFKTGSVLLRLVQNWNSLLQKWILRPPTEPSRRPPPAAPSCLMSRIKMAEKAAAATSIAK